MIVAMSAGAPAPQSSPVTVTPHAFAERPVVLRSVLLSRIGVPHAFTTRIGGVSAEPFASLNFGNPGDLPKERRDPIEAIRENQRRVLEAIGAGGRTLREVWQVHGDKVCTWRDGECIDLNALPAPTPFPREHDGDCKADAIVSNEPGCAVGVRVADCAPILLSSADARVVAAVHAGWRGVVSGVLPKAIASMRAIGAQQLVAVIGPCISMEHFEVGEEVAAEFARVFGSAHRVVRRDLGSKPHIDLKLALRDQAIDSGLGASAVEVLPHCTFRDRGLFFSHRRDAGLTGRMIAMIGVRARF